MSPQQPKGFNWTILAVVLSAATTILYVGRTTGRIEEKVENVERSIDRQSAKDGAQDTWLLGHESRLTSVETDMSAVKAGRYNNVIERLPNTPRFGK